MNRTSLIFCTLIILIPYFSFGLIKGKEKALSDSTEITINKIFVGGNKKTKERIIKRELLFQYGDTLFKVHLDDKIEKSKNNLLNTSLFNYVTINTVEVEKNIIDIYVLVEERWYLWPYLIFEHADRNLSSFLHNKDWSRINYGLMLVKNNFRGRGETLKFKFRFGYKEQFQLAYEIPYIGKSRQHGLSAEFNWFRQHEIPYITEYDALVFYKDENSYISKMFGSRLTYQFRNKHYLRHSFSATYSFSEVGDTIIKLNANYFGKKTNKTQYLGLIYNLNLDRRNYKYYPLSGYNIEVNLSQKGLNILSNEIQGVWEIGAGAYYYLGLSDRWFSGFGAQGKISSNLKQPFYIERGLGYATFLRSFEYNVIDGQSLATGRAFIKYAIIPIQVKHIESWGWAKFNKIHYSLYINTFFDTGYVHDVFPNNSNTLPNSFLASAGIGIDLVAYYDQVIRFEYSINRFGASGFFLHVGKAF